MTNTDHLAAPDGPRRTATNGLVTVVADDGRRMGVRVLPYRSRTHLAILDLDNHPWFFARHSLPPTSDAWIIAVADLAVEDPDYNWDTPRYRELCAEAGLDPDHRRPRFSAENRVAGDVLLAAVNLTSHAPTPAAANVLHDLLDLVRIDGWAQPRTIDDVRRDFAGLTRDDPKAAAEVFAVVTKIPGFGAQLLGTDEA